MLKSLGSSGIILFCRVFVRSFQASIEAEGLYDFN